MIIPTISNKLALLILLCLLPSCVTDERATVNQYIDYDFTIDSEASKKYFFDFTFDEVFIGTDGSREVFSGTFRRNWYSSQLEAMNEISLTAKLTPEEKFIRFLWLRSFDNPVSIRIEIDPGEQGMLFFVMADGAGGYAPGEISNSFSRQLTVTEIQELNSLLVNADICTSESRKSVPLDGAQWIFERRHGNNYCVIDRWSPKDDPYFALGIYLLDLAGFEESEDQRIY